MACVNVIAADTDEQARSLATSLHLLILGLIRNNRKPLAPPVGDMDRLWSREEQAAVNQMLHYSFVGSRDTLATELTSFMDHTAVDELMIATHIFDVDAKVRSLELTASLFKTNAVETFA